jgi:GT2 family glycosyltransferase
MAVHNGMPFVEESVRSILAQTFADFEFVIGDDGSTDGSGELLGRFAQSDRRIRLLRRETASGLAASANWVVGEARAPIVAIAHADDASAPERLERQLAVFDEHPEAVLVAALADVIDESGRKVRPPPVWRLRAGAPFAPFPHSSVAFRRDAFVAVGGYRAEAEYWEDFDLYLRLAERGRLMVLPQALASVRQSRSSTRLRDEDFRVLQSVDVMYRAADLYRRGSDLKRALSEARVTHRKLHPLAFVARGSINLWAGGPPGVLRQLLRRGELRPNVTSLRALVWALWGQVSPGTLRGFMNLLLALRNRGARHLLEAGEAVEWRPRPER